MQRAVHVHNDAKVYTSDGSRIGKAGETRLPRVFGGASTLPSRPPGNPIAVHGELIDLDITGTLEPLAASQPAQESRGVQPHEGENARVANVAGSDVGTDYKQMGETADPHVSQPTGDERVTHGYVKVNTGLDSSDLYVPLSAIAEVTQDRVTLNVSRDQINGSTWGSKPPSHLFDTDAEVRIRKDTGGDGSATHEGGNDEHHVVSVGSYLVVFGLLVVLTGLTILAATIDLGGVVNEVVAVGIAAVKATLVVLFFMHVRYSTPMMRIVVSVGFVFFGIMVLFTMGDFVSRDWKSTPPRDLGVMTEGFSAPEPTGGVMSPQPTGAAGRDELVPAGTVNPGR
ncbi:MAG: cytochrome C oxidase subunit IV family protein [Chloroflexota bacterium]|nr:cytochrome C oxidase subunit IV family protein [Chloroflexota bacterium]